MQMHENSDPGPFTCDFTSAPMELSIHIFFTSLLFVVSKISRDNSIAAGCAPSRGDPFGNRDPRERNEEV